MARLRRAFIALPVTARGGPTALARLCAALPARNRPQRPDDLHVTLAFLGDCECGAALAAWKRAAAFPPLAARLKLGRAVLLGGGRAAGFDLDPATALETWMRQHRDALIEAATGAGTACSTPAPGSVHTPRPHLTVAWLQRRPPPELADATLRRLAAAEGCGIHIGRLALWCRGDGTEAGGRRYRPVREIALPSAAD